MELCLTLPGGVMTADEGSNWFYWEAAQGERVRLSGRSYDLCPRMSMINSC